MAKKKRSPARARAISIPFASIEWISVDTRLPKFEQEVLVSCNQEIGHCVLSHVDQHGLHWIIVGSSGEFSDVIAWAEMPLMPNGKRARGAQ